MLLMFASGLSGAPRIAQGGKPSQGVTAIDPVMHQEAFDEGPHLVPAWIDLSQRQRNCSDVSGISRSSRSRSTLDTFSPRLTQAGLHLR
jgi:hypothetical protein